MKSINTWINRLACVSLLLAASNPINAATRTWDGGAGNTIINTAVNWSGDLAPNASGDFAVWDGTVQTNAPFVWNAGFGPGSGNGGAPTFQIGAGYPSPLILMNSGAGGNLSLSNIVIDAGAGAFTLGSNGITSVTVFRGGSTNWFINNSTSAATIAESVQFNNGGGASRTLSFGGSGDWVSYSPIYAAGSGTIAIRVNGTGANTLTLNGSVMLNPTTASIFNGTMRLLSGDALATSGTQTLTIDGGAGVKRLTLTTNIYLNAAVANLNIAGRDDPTGVANAAIYSMDGDNTINGIVRFNAVGGTNVGIYTEMGTLTFNGNLTAANVTGNRYFRFDGAGTNIVTGLIANGSATLGLRLAAGRLVLNNANTHTGDTIIDGGILTLGNELAVQNSAVVVNGGILDLNGAVNLNPSIGGFSGTGVVDTLSGGTVTLAVGNNNLSSSFSGNLTNSSGVLSLQKVGTGTFSLGGASGYSGDTVTANGILRVDNTTGSGTGTGNVAVNPSATLGGTGRIQGSVNWQSGSSALFVVNPTTAVSGSNSTPLTVLGSITLSGNAVVVNVPGGTPLEVGTYKLMSYNNTGSSGSFAATPAYTGAGAALGTFSSVSASGGTVTLTIVQTGVGAAWTNNGSGDWSVDANWSGNYAPRSAGDSALLGVGTAFTTVALDTNVSLGTLVFSNANSFLVGDATKTLSFDNSPYGGATVAVQAGTSNEIGSVVALNSDVTVLLAAGTSLAVTNTLANGSGTHTLAVSGGGTVALSGNNNYGPVAGTVGTVLGSGSVLQLSHNNAIGAGDLSVASSSTVRAGAALTLANNIITSAGATATVDNNGNNVTLSGVISGAGNFTKNSPGTLTLNSASTFTGATIINNGVLKAGVTGAVPGGVGFGSVTINTNASLDLNATSQTFNGLNGAGTVDSSAAGAMTLTVGEDGANGTFTGSLKNTAGTLALVKNGAGVQTLAGTNMYSGGTTISAGTLQIGNGGVVGSLGAGAVVNNSILTFNLLGTNTVSAAISGSGQVNLANAGMHLFLTGANSFSGNVNVNAGHLWVNNPASLGIGPKTITVTAGGVSALTMLHLTGNITIDSSIGYQLSYFGGAVVNESGNNTLQGDIGLPFGGGAAYLYSKSGLLVLSGTISAINSGRTLLLGGEGNGLISGTITDSGAGGQIGALQKTNSGTWTLSGANSSVATATVLAGKLVVDGQWAGPLVVNSNATLAGIGYIGQNLTCQTGALANFTVTELGGANTTPLTVGGSLIANNNPVTVHVPGGTPLPAGTYTLLSYNAAGSSGSFAATPVITGAGLPNKTFASVITANGIVSLLVANNFNWTNNGSGNWTTVANWDNSPNVPSNPGDFATFGVGTSLTTVNLDAAKTVGGMVFSNANSFILSSAVNTLTVDNSGSGALISVTDGVANSIAVPVAATDNAVINVVGGKALSISGSISGAGALAKNGGGTLTLSGTNTYAGTTTINAGLLALGSTNPIGAGALVLSGGNLDSLVPNLVNPNNNDQTWNASFGFLGSQSLNLGIGNVALNANLTLTVSSNTLTVGGIISGPSTLTKAGSGTLTLNGANGASLTGSVTINDGTIAIGDDTALGSGVLVFNSGTAAIQSVDSTARTLANNVTASFGGIYRGTGNLTFSGTVASGNFPKTFAISNALTIFSGPLTDGGAPNGPNFKDGPGTLILSADNSPLTKAMIVNAGTLALGNSTAIGSGLLTLNGGGLDSTVLDLVSAFNNPQSWNGSFHFVGTENLDLGTGTVTMNANTTITVSNKTLTVGGVINGGNFALSKAGPGTLLLNGATAYGNTTVSGGTLELAQATLRSNATVSVSSASVLKLNFSTTNQISSLVLNGVSQPNGVYGSSTPGGYLAGPGYLKVVYLGPSGPVQLTNSVTGSTLNLSWPPGQGWRLQAQTNALNIGLSNNWSYLTDGSVSSANIPIDPTKPTVFFRLVYP